MAKISTPDLFESVANVRTVAIFFHDLADALAESSSRSSSDVMAVARRAGLTVPAVLEGFKFKRARQAIDAKSLRQAVTVELPPHRVSEASVAKRTIGPICFDGKKTVAGVTLTVKICVTCSYSFPTTLKCTVTITATIST